MNDSFVANPTPSQGPQPSNSPGASRETPSTAETGKSKRLLSVDALRGFDMFWIVGGDTLVHALYKALPIAPLLLLHNQMDHKDWAGLAFYDLIFPLFVFIVGVSTVFSLSRVLEQGGKAAAIKRILVRSIVLYVFGLLIYGGISKGLDHVRWLGVLQRIAIAYFFTALIFLTFRLRGMLVICASLLIGYWALTSFVPVRDFNLEKSHLRNMGLTPESPATKTAFLNTTNLVSGRFDDGLNLPQQIDYLYLPGYKWDGAYDPEGLLSTLPAVGTCLLGVFAGLLLRNRSIADQRKVLYLGAAGLAGIAVGFLWGLQFPVIKKIWTSSYVLVAGGYACVFLALFYQAIEIQGWRKWCVPFVWIGMNPITIYLAAHFVHFEELSRLVLGGPIEKAAGNAGSLLVTAGAVVLMFAFMRFLYVRKIFLRL